MRLFAFLICLVGCNFCFGQSKLTPMEKDTLIPFNGSKTFHLFGDEARVIPFDSKIPLYVCINYDGSQKINYEYFRIDSSKYLVREYFRNANINSNDGIKSTGVKVIKNQLFCDTTLHKIFDANNDETDVTRAICYKEFLKEGEWEEYEDSTFNAIRWTGSYRNNKRTGIWTRSINIVGKNLILEEINYDTDSTKKTYTNNLIPNIRIDSLKLLLNGRWSLETCDDFSTKRMFYYRCQKLNGTYGPGCNFDYYQLFESNEFIRHRMTGCSNFGETSIKGAWELKELNGQRMMEVKFTNGRVWKFKILYLDKDMQFVTERI